MDYKPYARWQIETLSQRLSERRVVVIEGPRQCGKTTLAQSMENSDRIYCSLDDSAVLSIARSDPRGFVRHDNELMIIDEVQRLPDLLPAIKLEVDRDKRPGRFLLTGSANIQSLPGVTESLAGRVSKIRLRPLALGEIHGSAPDFLENAFNQTLRSKSTKESKNEYLEEAFKGGFPEARLLQERPARRWHNDYIHTLIERDLQDITNIKRKDSMLKLIEVLAAWSSKFMDINSICSSLGLSRPTVESYINALETLYLVERVRPWYKGDYDRIGKQDKIFMADTGLMAAMLGWQFETVRFDGEKNGKLLETFVFNQLSAQLDVHQYDYKLTHYRDREKREIDFVIERTDGAVLGIEVKAGSYIDKSMLKHLTWFRDRIIPGQPFVGIILYTGEHVLPFGENLWVVPMNCLW